MDGGRRRCEESCCTVCDSGRVEEEEEEWRFLCVHIKAPCKPICAPVFTLILDRVLKQESRTVSVSVTSAVCEVFWDIRFNIIIQCAIVLATPNNHPQWDRCELD